MLDISTELKEKLKNVQKFKFLNLPSNCHLRGQNSYQRSSCAIHSIRSSQLFSYKCQKRIWSNSKFKIEAKRESSII